MQRGGAQDDHLSSFRNDLRKAEKIMLDVSADLHSEKLLAASMLCGRVIGQSNLEVRVDSGVGTLVSTVFSNQKELRQVGARITAAFPGMYNKYLILASGSSRQFGYLKCLIPSQQRHRIAFKSLEEEDCKPCTPSAPRRKNSNTNAPPRNQRVVLRVMFCAFLRVVPDPPTWSGWKTIFCRFRKTA